MWLNGRIIMQLNHLGLRNQIWNMPKKPLKPSTTNWQKTKRKLGCDKNNFFKWGRKLEWLKSENILYQIELLKTNKKGLSKDRGE
jgi:hypothetical protein